MTAPSTEKVIADAWTPGMFAYLRLARSLRPVITDAQGVVISRKELARRRAIRDSRKDTP